ncbi:MAG: TIGR02452 family protein, partial [Acidobacteriota bacterium]|nr:TIGR02452 family protein [Acidobacteriota bacterium]
MQIILDAIAGLTLGEPIVRRQMAMLPLLDGQAGAAPRAYLTLDEALAAGTAQVTEVSHDGSVPELLFRNAGAEPVLLVEGEELLGARQNRTLNVSILAPPQQETRIPVSCVERGRWGYDDEVVFHRSDRSHFARGRRSKLESVNRGMSRDPGSRHSDQGAVWDAIDDKLAAMSVSSPTDAMGAVYEQHRASLDDYVAAFRSRPGQVGAVLLVGSRFAGLDLFAHESTCAALLPKLLRGYALDALEVDSESGHAPPPAAAPRVIAGIVAGGARADPAGGLGRGL